ncbi:UDP-glycosyltransferase 83A1 [Ricinus communis]|uniref:UDP-glucuronosyltransferase, putative n=1 Tax=Ricinus communis TaxID=3988 RepID=B9SJD8_RICCO|nr:UDP-glycosyltransferase 83A1 [Ricinus communis]EEF36301.1 UDP-glucuronosyltransferase, putative [Ricinus communis]|eukprot:XP_002526107.1 UDP-glycosyltransferase 83A1 [Ricinus communis]
MGKLHVLAIPYPAQGHVIPMLELSQCLVKHGFEITFVNTDYNHKRVLNALGNDFLGDQISLVSIPDGLELWEDRNDLGKLTEAIFNVMPGKLEELINRSNASKDKKITCIIADANNGWALEVAEKMNIRCAAFWPASAALLSSLFTVQKLIDDGIIDNNGTPLKNQIIQMDPTMPAISTENLVWNCIGDSTTQKIIFDVIFRNNKAVKVADWIICNSAYDLEPGALTLSPKILPIGPMLASSRQGDSAGYFWQKDLTCLKWLDQQPPKSVIYVAFGSFTVFDKTQFQELALGLELSGRSFIWVVRPDITTDTNAYPEGFLERVGSRGQMVGWAPQQKVLNHPSIACFLSHCGWNSTMEGVANGVPFLCWPYFADQFLNESYICDVWKVGLKFNKSKSGIITREEIKDKVGKVLSDEGVIARASELKEIAMINVGEYGYSSKILKHFIEGMQI